MSNSLTQRRNMPIFDCAKYLLSLMVVAIHSELFLEYLFPWLALAVPLFFIISSYFFHKKLLLCDSEDEKKEHLKVFIRRNIELYLFWFAIEIIPTIFFYMDYYMAKAHGNLIFIPLVLLRDFIFNSTYPASWFIMANIIGTFIVFNMSKKLKRKTVLLVTFFIYIITCVQGGYMFLFEEGSIIHRASDLYTELFTAMANSFPVSLFWIAIGKFFAETDFEYSTKKLTSFTVLSVPLLYAESKYLELASGSNVRVCYILEIPLVLCLFMLICKLSKHFYKLDFDSKLIRRLSTIIYSTHGMAIFFTRGVLKLLDIPRGTVTVYVMTVILCTVGGIILIKLQKCKHFKWLRYAY